MNKIAKNYIYNLAYQLLILVIPLITTPYVSRTLGAKGIGIFSYTNSIVQYFILFGCIGLNLYGQREIAYVQHDNEKKDTVFWELVVLRIITVSVALLVYTFTVAASGKYVGIFRIMSLDILASMVDISWLFQGMEECKKIVVRNLIVKIISVILIFGFVKTATDLWLYILFQSGASILGNLSMWLYVPGLVKKRNFKSLNVSRHIKPTIVLFLPQIATSVYMVLDKTMIGLLTDSAEEVAYYEQAQKIVKLVLALATSLGTVMLPRVANLFKLKAEKQIKEYLNTSFRLTSFLAIPMLFGLIAISCNLVPWFFGEGYDRVIPNMMIISPILFFISWSNIIGMQYLLPTARQREYTASVIVGCCVNFILNLLFISAFASIGASVATVIAEGSVTFFQIYFTRNDFNYTEIIKSNVNYIYSSIVMLVVIYPLARFLTPTFMHTCICVLCGAIIYIGGLWILKDEEIARLRETILSVIKHCM